MTCAPAGRCGPGCYSLPRGPQGEVLDGPLLDLTVYNPSLFWAAGNLTSDFGDLARFFRALLGGRLLPPRLLVEMMTPVDRPAGRRLRPGAGVFETPSGRLVGHDGALPGFHNVVLSTEDGRRQLGVMMNQEVAMPAVYEAFNQAFMTIAMRLLEAAPLGGAAASANAPTPPSLPHRLARPGR